MRGCIVLVLAISLLASPAKADDAKDFSITIDGKDFAINPGETITAKTKTGQDIGVSLKRNEFSTYKAGGISFEHRSDLSVASSDIAKDIHQHTVVTAVGTILIVQRYDFIDPSSLAQLMVQEISKDDVRAGAKLETKEKARNLSDGKEMKGLYATAKGGGRDVQLEVLAMPMGRGGILAMTRMDMENAADQPIVDHFWKSLRTSSP
jgi:hypothetical protein